MRLELTYTQPQLDIFFSKLAKYTLVTKGRRFGLTQGGAHACIEWAADGDKILWGDTVVSNIDRYVDRYFKPVLELYNIPYHWAKQDKVMKIFNGHIDFRSADRPENWEGFGYDKIFLNEAGIILKNPYLYTNAVLPMLLDNTNSKLIAGGVPKGELLKDGAEHPFYTLCERAKQSKDYNLYEFSSYDNPLLKKSDIEDLEKEISVMSPSQVDQEIYGKFIKMDASNPFILTYDPEKHEAPVKQDPNKIVYASMDFNINPFGIIFGHSWRDGEGYHVHIFKAVTVSDATMEKMANVIRGTVNTSMLRITGDATGNNKRLGSLDNLSYFQELSRLLKLRPNQVMTGRSNPTQKKSRTQCNEAFMHHPDIKFDPVECADLITDFKIVQCNAFGEIIKRNRNDISQRAELLDCWRYFEHTHLKEWRSKFKAPKRMPVTPTVDINSVLRHS